MIIYVTASEEDYGGYYKNHVFIFADEVMANKYCNFVTEEEGVNMNIAHLDYAPLLEADAETVDSDEEKYVEIIITESPYGDILLAENENGEENDEEVSGLSYIKVTCPIVFENDFFRALYSMGNHQPDTQLNTIFKPI